jgi:hypothetical protein
VGCDEDGIRREERHRCHERVKNRANDRRDQHGQELLRTHRVLTRAELTRPNSAPIPHLAMQDIITLRFAQERHEDCLNKSGAGFDIQERGK